MSDMDVYHTQNEGDRPVEKSPRGRYIRFDIRLGQGAYKTVWKAYDTDQGIDVAWNAIDIGVLPSSEKTRIIQEVQLLQKLEHKNIINFYGSWFSKEKNQVVFITEIMTSGTLKSYIKRVHFVKWKIIKRWCIQILEGLHYLHNQNPPVIHRDLKCDNIFINGNTGDLRIGDLGLSTQLAVHKRSKAQSVLGTPEFMAPELYDESYDEKVDIYAFGMCVLEMVTKEVPYSECINPAQIYKKVTAGIRPRGLQRIISQPARDFIELCLSRGNGKVDVSAEYLLDHPFLKASDDDSDMVKVLDDDELERDAPPLPPVSPPMNPKQFADELNMESGSKGNDAAATSDRRKNFPSLSLEPEELASGHSMAATSGGGQGQRTDIPAEEKSAGKHRMLLPPKVPTTAAAETSAAPSAVATTTTTTAPQPSGSGNGSEPVVDEPLSDKKGESNHHVDNFLSGLPPNEVNIRNDRIAVMGGRGHRIEIDEAQVYADDENERKGELSPVPENPAAAAMSSSSQESERSSTANGAAPATAAESAPNSAEPTRQRPNTADATRSTRPPSASRKRGKSYNIKATKDPENDHSILLNLRMALDGKSKEIKFPFNLFTDSSHEVACELAVDVGILEPDLEDIADSISFLVTEGKINNLPDFDQDVWDEAPEPHSFPTKALPPVSKLTFGSAPPAHPLTSAPLEIETVAPLARATQPSTPVAIPAVPPSTPLVTPMSIRELSTGSTSDPGGMLSDAGGLPPLDAGMPLTSSASLVVERSLSPPLATAMVHAASESALYNPEEGTMQEGREHSMSMGSAVDANYLRSVRLYEDRMKMARSSYDERESSLETAIRNEEEKHQREIERIRKKMQEFNEKTARATMARQERMRLGTDELKDVDVVLDEWSPSGSQGSATSSQPSLVVSSGNEDTTKYDRPSLEPSSAVPPQADSASTTTSGVSLTSVAMEASAVPDGVGRETVSEGALLATQVDVTHDGASVAPS